MAAYLLTLCSTNRLWR